MGKTKNLIFYSLSETSPSTPYFTFSLGPIQKLENFMENNLESPELKGEMHPKTKQNMFGAQSQNY